MIIRPCDISTARVAELGWPAVRIGMAGGGLATSSFRSIRREEWVTASRPVRVPVQLALFSEAA